MLETFFFFPLIFTAHVIYRLYLIAASFTVSNDPSSYDQLPANAVCAYVFKMASESLGLDPLACKSLEACIDNAGADSIKRHAACDECSKSTIVMLVYTTCLHRMLNCAMEQDIRN